MRLLRRSTISHRAKQAGHGVRATQAGPFAQDLLQACADAFLTFGGHTGNTFLRLPITVPFDDEGMVQLGSAPPQPDAPRVPATLEITCRVARFDLALCRVDGRPLLIPGVFDATGNPAGLVRVTFAVTGAGMDIAGTGADGRPVALELDETTARALATALLITIGVKLAKAERAAEARNPDSAGPST